MFPLIRYKINSQNLSMIKGAAWIKKRHNFHIRFDTTTENGSMRMRHRYGLRRGGNVKKQGRDF